jgi:hypothetical protein
MAPPHYYHPYPPPRQGHPPHTPSPAPRTGGHGSESVSPNAAKGSDAPERNPKEEGSSDTQYSQSAQDEKPPPYMPGIGSSPRGGSAGQSQDATSEA